MKLLINISVVILLLSGCSKLEKSIPIIIDTDANNELDDQHALAYAFFNQDVFGIKGVTVNATHNGGNIEDHYKEAKRVMQLCNVWGNIPLRKGADSGFSKIESQLNNEFYDGKEAVDFIIQEALKIEGEKLILVPIGKLTNIALAVKKAPEIKSKIRVVWLGSNYPKSGEYNLINDIDALNYILNQEIQFEMVMVRYREKSGAADVRITPNEITNRVRGLGPKVQPVNGRHGGSFNNFGDYSEDLFSHIVLESNPPSRAMFDMVALAIIKNSEWGESYEIGSPFMRDNLWHERPNNTRKVVIWENFDRESIIEDFIVSLENQRSL